MYELDCLSMQARKNPSAAFTVVTCQNNMSQENFKVT